MKASTEPGLVPALVLPLSAPDTGRLVVIETTAPLAERSGRAVERVIEKALDASTRRARALGLPWARLHTAVACGDMMIVQVLAGDGPGGRVRPGAGRAPRC